MGDYIYALRSPKLQKRVAIKLLDGNIIEENIASMSYLFKPHWFTCYDGNDYDKKYWRVVDRLIHLWNGITPPTHVALTERKNLHKIKIGQPVYGFKDRNKNICKTAPNYYSDGADTWFEVGTIVEIL